MLLGMTCPDVCVDETPVAGDTVRALAYAPFVGLLSLKWRTGTKSTTRC